MRGFLHSIAPAALLVVGVLAYPAAAQQDAKQDTSRADSKDAKTGKEKPFSPKTTRFIAKLIAVEGAQRYLTVEVTRKIGQPNLQAAANVANLQRQLFGTRDPNQAASLRIEILKNQQNMISYKDDVHKVELEAPDDLKVRTMLAPVDYDDKGRPKKLTEKEKRALRGPDPTLPGYLADFDSLKVDQQVEVYLAKSKSTPGTKSKDKDAAAETKRYKAAMIVILAEPQK